MYSSRLWRAAVGRPYVLPFFTLIAIGCGVSAHAATLSGRVVDPDQRPAAGARVIVSSPVGTIATQTTDADGRFRLDALIAGEYDLRVVLDGFQADAVHAALSTDDTRDVTIALRISAISESIVVSAAQTDVPLSRAADAVTVVTAADLQSRQIETAGDALRMVPGISVNRSGGRGTLTSLFPRGGGSNYTLVLVDGIRMNSFGGGFDFAHLPVDDIDHIEIVRGPESALFGSDAIGAVVQIVTARGGPMRAGGLVEGGNEGTERAAAHAAGTRGAWRWGGGTEQSRSTGFTGIAPASGEKVTNNDDHLRQGWGSLSWQRSGTEVALSGNLEHDERGYPGPFGSDPIAAFSGVDTVSRGINDRRQVGARIDHPWSARVRQRADVSVFDLSSSFASPFGDSTSGTRRVDARIQEDAAVSPWIGLSGGVEFLRERGASTYITGATDEAIPIQRGVTGVFGELRLIGRDRVSATAGVRVERISRDSVEPNFSQFSARPAFPEQTITSANPHVAVSYVLAGAAGGAHLTRVRASAGTGIRPPDAFEISFTDNPNLKPERNRSVDAGVEQQLASGRVVIGATTFFNRYDDLLVTIGRALRDASRFKTDNISNARARGLELTAAVRPASKVAVRASYTFLDSEILSVDGLDRIAPPLGSVIEGTATRSYAVGDPLTRRPRHRGGFDVTYTAARFNVFGELTARGRTLDVEPNFGSFGGLFFCPGYGVVNAGASVRVARYTDVYARVMNLADRQYEESLGFPALRRSAIVGVRIAASR